MLLARRSRQPLEESGALKGPVLHSRALSLAPQVSFNFGHRDGWSYVSAGVGSGSFETWAETGENPGRRVRVINYGGGARWFNTSHLAFNVDLRFYQVAQAAAVTGSGDRPGARLLVLSAGVSVR